MIAVRLFFLMTKCFLALRILVELVGYLRICTFINIYRTHQKIINVSPKVIKHFNVWLGSVPSMITFTLTHNIILRILLSVSIVIKVFMMNIANVLWLLNVITLFLALKILIHKWFEDYVRSVRWLIFIKVLRGAFNFWDFF